MLSKHSTIVQTTEDKANSKREGGNLGVYTDIQRRNKGNWDQG
jgi:hypothetical protein